MVRMLIEVVVEHLRLTEARLQPRPNPGVPAEGSITTEVPCSFRDSRLSRRICLEQAAGKRTIAAMRSVDILARGTIPRKTGTLVRVVADEHRNVIEALCFVESVLIGRNDLAINDRPSQAACRREQPRGRQLAQFRDGRGTCCFRELDAGPFSLGKKPHVLAGASGGAGRPE